MAGFAKGFGKGTSGFLTHNGNAIVGLVAYPAQGLYKTVVQAINTGRAGEVAKAKIDVGRWLAGRQGVEEGGGTNGEVVVRLFDEVSGRKGFYEGT